MDDRDAKGRGNQAKGSNHGNAKLTEKSVRKIRKRYKTGKYTQTELAHELGVSIVLIGKIVNRRLWVHI